MNKSKTVAVQPPKLAAIIKTVQQQSKVTGVKRPLPIDTTSTQQEGQAIDEAAEPKKFKPIEEEQECALKQLIPEKWREFLRPLTNKPSFKKLSDIVFEEYGKYGEYMFPPQNKIFNALEQIGSPEDVRVVINGQDPFHSMGQANGMSFAVNRDVKIPPSLVNIYKEIQSDMNIEPASHGDLTCWAQQGVLLLNSCLTVLCGKPASHFHLGWQEFTSGILKLLDQKVKTPIVYLAWGKPALAVLERAGVYVNGKPSGKNRLVLNCPHPSPFSAHTGFFGCKHFSKTNDFLKKHNCEPIEWKVI